MIAVAGGISFGLAWGWLLAQRLGSERRLLPATGIAGAAALAAGAEAALLASGIVALAVVAATGAGILLRAAFGLAIRRAAA